MSSTRRVLFVSSNGSGMGHLTRLLAAARRASDDVLPVFFTVSSAFPLVAAAGFPVEYLASPAYSGLPNREWNSLLRRRLTDMVATHRPSALVFDGTFPYRGLMDVREAFPDLPFVWSRRAMWKPGVGRRQLDRSSAFQLVLEPGEFAAAVDAGLTATAEAGPVTRVRPITLLDPEELLDPAAARAELRLDPERPAALVALGAGNINDTSSQLGMVVAQLRKVPDLQVCVTRSVIAKRVDDLPAGVVPVSTYPISRCYGAFAFAVSAAGYNSYHELIGFGVPTIFLPNQETVVDDQVARARYAADTGVGLCVEDDKEFGEALDKMLDPRRRETMRVRAGEIYPGNGAAEAMAAIEALALDAQPPQRPAADTPTRRPLKPGEEAGARTEAAGAQRPVTGPPRHDRRGGMLAVVRLRARLAAVRERAARLWRAPAPPEKVVPRPDRVDPLAQPLVPPEVVPAGRHLSGHAPADLPVILVNLVELPPEAVALTVDRVATEQRTSMTFKPLFVTSASVHQTIARHGFLFEHVMSADQWARLQRPGEWEGYVQRRLAAIQEDYGPYEVVTVGPSDSVDGLGKALRRPRPLGRT